MRGSASGAAKYASNILPSCHRPLIPDDTTERWRRHWKQIDLMGSKVHVYRRCDRAKHRQTRHIVDRRLPITDFAHKARVVGDDLMGAVFAARDMTAERRGAAVLDRRHHFQLAEAHMAGVGLTPSRAMVAEDIRDLQDGALHEKWASGGRFGLGGVYRRDFGQVQTEPFQRTRHVSDRIDGDARVKRRRFELGVSERTRVMMLLSLRH